MRNSSRQPQILTEVERLHACIRNTIWDGATESVETKSDFCQHVLLIPVHNRNWRCAHTLAQTEQGRQSGAHKSKAGQPTQAEIERSREGQS